MIETGNVRLAAARVTDDEIAGLETRLAAMAACIDDPARFSELDIAMHTAVCAAAENFLLLQFMNIISTLGRVSRERTGGLRAVREAALEDHRRIVEALRRHDPDAAEAAMRRHLDHVDAGLKSVLGPDETRPAGTGDVVP